MAEHAGLIPIGQAARLLMISEERIRQLVKQGFIPKPEKRGFVQLVGAVQGYAQRAREKALRETYGLPDHQYQGISTPSGDASDETPGGDPSGESPEQ